MTWDAATRTCVGVSSGVEYDFLTSVSGQGHDLHKKVASGQATYLYGDWAIPQNASVRPLVLFLVCRACFASDQDIRKGVGCFVLKAVSTVDLMLPSFGIFRALTTEK